MKFCSVIALLFSSALSFSAGAQDSPKNTKKKAPAFVPIVDGAPSAISKTEPSASSSPASAPVTQPDPASEPAPLAQVATTKATPKELSIGSSGKLAIHALLQAWADSNPTAEKFGTETDATFRVRRAELRFSGELISGRVSYNIMTDLARGLFKLDKPVTVEHPDGTTSTVTGVVADNVVPLRDIYTVVKTKHFDVWLGQFKIPISLEGMTSPAQLLFPERAVSSKTFGDKRDLGFKVEKRDERIYYSASIYNGAGENRLDTDQTKEIAGRLELTPKLSKHAKFLFGAAGLSSVGPFEQQHKQVIEGDFRVEAFGALFQGEVIASFTQSAADANGEQTTKPALGCYAQTAYMTKPGVQLAARFGMLDPDAALAATNDKEQLYEVGASLNYFFTRDEKKGVMFTDHPEYHEVKLQAAFLRFIPTEGSHQATNEAIIALQSWF